MGELYRFRKREEKEMGKTTIFNVADAFLSIEHMSHKKLQKMCYYAYSWYLTLYNERLFNNRFEAWIHGPVDPLLYQEYKHYGRQPIDKSVEVALEDDFHAFVHEVYDSYGEFDGDQLEYLTHQEAPWIQAREGVPEYEPCKNPIEDEVIVNFYRQVLEEEQYV